jgi:hypothetical protein
MCLRAVLTIAFACLSAVPLAQAADCKSTVSGDLRIHPLTSKIFNNTRSIRVLLPPGYGAAENSSKRYPVLYMLDGQNLFDACLSDVSHAEWQVDETVYRLMREKAIPEMIVVGIDHAGVKRAYEFLPYRDSFNPDMEEPAGKRFPDFLVNEVMPLVNGQYRTLTGHAIPRSAARRMAVSRRSTHSWPGRRRSATVSSKVRRSGSVWGSSFAIPHRWWVCRARCSSHSAARR